MEESIKGKFFSHYRTHKIYKVLDDNVLMENPTTEDWIPGVIYEEYGYLEGTEIKEIQIPKKFIRSRDRFMNSFGEIAFASYILEPTNSSMIANYDKKTI